MNEVEIEHDTYTWYVYRPNFLSASPRVARASSPKFSLLPPSRNKHVEVSACGIGGCPIIGFILCTQVFRQLNTADLGEVDMRR